MLQTTDQFQFLESVLFETFGRPVQMQDFQFLYCGNFNLAARVTTDLGTYFVKWNQGDHAGMFETEARGLDLLRAPGVLHIPVVHGYGERPGGAYLVLEFIQAGPPVPQYWADFGQRLAQLHRQTAPQHGLDFDNYIGALPQKNEYRDNGVLFFIENRLQVQAGRALYEGKITTALYEQLQAFFERLPGMLPDEAPALLHGDLWSGNVMTGTDGQVVLVDPSAHYGLRESELAFTTMFGGFDESFYAAYAEAFPLEPGFAERIPIYNLYPLLVHVNLFGGGYLTAVERVLRRF
jgi:protein-ribulosamine 3-kinase